MVDECGRGAPVEWCWSQAGGGMPPICFLPTKVFFATELKKGSFKKWGECGGKGVYVH